MKKTLYALILILCLTPSVAVAFMGWESSPGDKSIEYLGYLFGTVGTVLSPPPGASLIFGALFKVFNLALLGMGSIVMVYIIWISAIETAHEGEVLGKKWSAAWIPIRAILGIGLLLPTASGYSSSQVLMMWLVMQSVHVANTTWTVALENFQVRSVFKTPTEEGMGDVKGASEAAQAMFMSLICMEMLNQEYPESAAGLGGNIELHEIQGGIVVGIPGDEHYAEVCGGLVPSKAVKGYDPDVWRDRQTVAADNAASFLSLYAEEAVMGESVSGSDVIMSARKIISGIVSTTSKIARPNAPDGPIDLDKVKTRSKEDGWLFAGAYYNKFDSWLLDFKDANLTAPQIVRINYEELPFTENLLKEKYTTYLKESDLISSDPSSPTKVGAGEVSGMSGGLAQVWNDAEISDTFTNIALDFIDAINGDNDSPLMAMHRLGANLMVTVEMLFFTIMSVVFVVAIIACALSGFQPVCAAVVGGLGLILPFVLILITLFWAAGATLGLYVPLIPYLVFLFAAVSWFILVVEAMAAVPVAALGLTNPSAENFGNISPMMTLSLSIFMRPTLMLIGFIAAERILMTLMYMINFGFAATVAVSISSLGIFGSVALVVLYVGIVLITVQECFGLIYILPDKVIRWIGGQTEKSTVAQNVQKAKGYLDKGAEAGGAMMKGAVSAVQSLAKDSSSSDGDDDAGGGDGSDGPEFDNPESDTASVVKKLNSDDDAGGGDGSDGPEFDNPESDTASVVKKLNSDDDAGGGDGSDGDASIKPSKPTKVGGGSTGGSSGGGGGAAGGAALPPVV